MSFDDYVAEVHSDIDRFRRFWFDQHKVCPESFPLEMGGGDWHDQWLMFLSSVEE